MAGQYSRMYRRNREALEADAEEKLQRPLTTSEQNLFRSCGTLTQLDTLGMIVYYAEDAAELETKLAETSMESRFRLSVEETTERLAKTLERQITQEEKQHLFTLGNIEALWELEERIQETPDDQRTIL